jgi:hypothetical protein
MPRTSTQEHVMTTQQHRASLARRQTEGRLHPRLVERRRLAALAELFTDAARKPDALYALTRRDPRCKLPDEKLRTLIHEGIGTGVISRERLVRYRLFQLLDDLAQFPDEAPASDVLYVRLMAEQAEALEAQARAQGLPTPANREHAVRETREAVAIQSIACAAYEIGALATASDFPGIR